MKGSEFIRTLPEEPGPPREQAILDAVDRGNHQHRWWTLQWSQAGHDVELDVSEDALAIGEPGDAVRVNVTATTAQRLADRLDAVLLTSHVADLVYQAAKVHLEACLQRPDAGMARTSRMAAHSRAVEERRGGRAGLCSTVGKDWILTNQLIGRPDRAANYGWHDAAAPARFTTSVPGQRVYQPVGTVHDRFHVDYSQTWRAMRRTVRIDGQEHEVAAVLADAALCPLLSSEGPIPFAHLDHVPLRPPAPAPRLPPVAAVPRVLRRGMAGEDVAMWQRVLGVAADGVFGPGVEQATKVWQEAHGLQPDGVVGPVSRAIAASSASVSASTYPFVPARWFTPTQGRRIRLLVLHTMEVAEMRDTAERVARYFQTMSDGRRASAHYCVDSDSIIQCVQDKDVAWHAPGANNDGIGIEHAGYASQSEDDWLDDYSQTMLRRSAQLAAQLCKRHGLPIASVGVVGLKAGTAGITTHAAVSEAFKKSTHYDPGPNFPMDLYLEMVREYAL